MFDGGGIRISGSPVMFYADRFLTGAALTEERLH